MSLTRKERILNLIPLNSIVLHIYLVFTNTTSLFPRTKHNYFVPKLFRMILPEAGFLRNKIVWCHEC